MGIRSWLAFHGFFFIFPNRNWLLMNVRSHLDAFRSITWYHRFKLTKNRSNCRMMHTSSLLCLNETFLKNHPRVIRLPRLSFKGLYVACDSLPYVQLREHLLCKLGWWTVSLKLLLGLCCCLHSFSLHSRWEKPNNLWSSSLSCCLGTHPAPSSPSFIRLFRWRAMGGAQSADVENEDMSA